MSISISRELADKAAFELATDKRYPLNRYIFEDVVTALMPCIDEALERAAHECDMLGHGVHSTSSFAALQAASHRIRSLKEEHHDPEATNGETK